MVLYARPLALLLGHAINRAHNATRVPKRFAAASGLGCDLNAGHLGCVVDQVDGAVTGIGNSAPFLDDHVHRLIVVLGDLMAGHEGIDFDDVDLAGNDLGNEIVDHGPCDHRSCSCRGGNHEWLVTSAVP